MKKIIMGALLLASANCLGGELVKDAEIVNVGLVANQKGEDINFYVEVAGGTGHCANKTIKFPLWMQSSDKLHTMLHNMALTAISDRTIKVTIGNKKGKTNPKTDCSLATYMITR